MKQNLCYVPPGGPLISHQSTLEIFDAEEFGPILAPCSVARLQVVQILELRHKTGRDAHQVLQFGVRGRLCSDL